MTRFTYRNHNFSCDPDVVNKFLSNLEDGEIYQMLPQDGKGLVPDSLLDWDFHAISGADLTSFYEGFPSGSTQICLEVWRRENNPDPGEPDYNVNRIIIGKLPDGNFYGFDVTDRDKPIKGSGQIAHHWPISGDEPPNNPPTFKILSFPKS